MFRVKADRCTNVSDRVKESYRIKKKRKEKHMNLLMIDNVYLLYRFRLKLIKLICNVWLWFILSEYNVEFL